MGQNVDNGMVALEGILEFISVHGVVDDEETVVIDINSGHGVVEVIIEKGVVSVRVLVREEVAEDVLVVRNEERVGKVVTAEEIVFSVLEICGEERKELVVAVSTVTALGGDREEDIASVDVEAGVMLVKDVVTSFVEVIPTVTPSVGDALEDVGEVPNMGIETDVLRVERDVLGKLDDENMELKSLNVLVVGLAGVVKAVFPRV